MKKNYLVVLLFSAWLLAACGSTIEEVVALDTVPAEYAGLTNPLGPEAAQDGAKVFKTNCEVCHGALGHGDGPAGVALDPAPKDLSILQATAADDYLYWRISTGKQGTSMVAWKGVLDEEQIWQVVAFLRTLK